MKSNEARSLVPGILVLPSHPLGGFSSFKVVWLGVHLDKPLKVVHWGIRISQNPCS